MTDYKILWSPRARENIKSICDYIEKEFKSSETAQKTGQNLFDKAYTLAFMPSRYPSDNTIPEYRFLIEGDYILYYRIKEQSKIVEIAYIRHQKQARLIK